MVAHHLVLSRGLSRARSLVANGVTPDHLTLGQRLAARGWLRWLRRGRRRSPSRRALHDNESAEDRESADRHHHEIHVDLVRVQPAFASVMRRTELCAPCSGDASAAGSFTILLKVPQAGCEPRSAAGFDTKTHTPVATSERSLGCTVRADDKP